MASAGNLVLIGLMGAGKTTLAAALGELLTLPVRDLDQAIEAASGESIGNLFEHYGEAHFRAQEHAMLKVLFAAEHQIIACGAGIVLAARNRDLLARQAFVIWLDAPLDLLERRLQGDSSRPLLRTPDLAARLAELAAQRDPLYAALADLKFEIRDEPAIEQAARLAHLLPENWRRAVNDE